MSRRWDWNVASILHTLWSPYCIHPCVNWISIFTFSFIHNIKALKFDLDILRIWPFISCIKYNSIILNGRNSYEPEFHDSPPSHFFIRTKCLTSFIFCMSLRWALFTHLNRTPRLSINLNCNCFSKAQRVYNYHLTTLRAFKGPWCKHGPLTDRYVVIKNKWLIFFGINSNKS